MTATLGICIFGDVVGSRARPTEATAWLERLRDRLETTCPRRLAAFEFTQGDEIQGLLPVDADALTPVLDAMLQPHDRPDGAPHMRWVIAAGRIDPGEGPATKRTGEAFLAARALITEAGRDGDGLRCRTGDREADALLDDVAPVLASIIDRMTDRQREVLHLQAIDGMRQEAIADRLGVSQPAISGVLARAGARDVARLTAAVRTLLRDGIRRTHGDGVAGREVR
ncbi:MAG: sigma factor-like helix-turn-helix DNA-binding protein [Candidatus Limnocylindrales bacterium]